MYERPPVPAPVSDPMSFAYAHGIVSSAPENFATAEAAIASSTEDFQTVAAQNISQASSLLNGGPVERKQARDALAAARKQVSDSQRKQQQLAADVETARGVVKQTYTTLGSIALQAIDF